MLFLTRRISEIVRIGDEISVTVVAVRGNEVRLGITAPRTVAVYREEIYERIKRGIPLEAAINGTETLSRTSRLK